jgi:hypothetical protein
MNLQEYKALFVIVTAVLALLVASPALQRVLVYPQTEFFTELALLGPGGTAENYPFNITRGVNYAVSLWVANHLGQCAYYLVEVKFRNQTQSAPDSFNFTASGLPSLCNITAFVADKESWELPLVFSFNYNESSYNATLAQVSFSSVVLNGAVLDLGGHSSVWDQQSSRFYGNLFFELWIYNDTVGAFTYHERYVDLKLNMTV